MLVKSENTYIDKAQNNCTDQLLANWLEVKSELKRELGDAAFKSWVEPIEFKNLDNKTLEISVATRFIRDWVKTHYAEKMRKIWSAKFGAIAHVNISIEKTANALVENSSENSSTDEIKTADDNAEITSALDARYTFENFVTGAENELAYAAAMKVATASVAQFNPLFIQGSVGLGKTHLMHAIAHQIQANNPDKKVIYLSAERFMFMFVRALRANNTMAFKEALRSADVLLMDDIQFICGKESTQEEFFHTFNALTEQNKQIVISSSKAPSELLGLDARLKSRLSGGLVAQIQNASYDLRVRILQQKCRMLNREIDIKVLELLADKITSNVRELEGALNRLIASSELLGREITIDTAQSLLQDVLQTGATPLSIAKIQQTVAEHYKIKMADMLSSRRSRDVAYPRQIAMYFAKTLTSAALPEIGRNFGGRDHTTVIHAVRKIEELVKQDASLRGELESLKRKISAV